jgi:pyridoxal phosphate enzyme (YggS family)
MQSVDTQLEDLRDRILRAARDAGREPGSVRLVAVSKTRTADDIRRVARAGVRDVGENYVAEALPKIAALADCGLTWHFIGAIQSNKTRDIALHFDWVHTVDREKIARRLSDQRPATLDPLNVLIQVNVDREPQKAGVAEERLAELAGYVATLPRLRLRGLMGIPRESAVAEEQHATFRRLAQLFASCRPAHADDWDSLSMGMSADFEIAISEGATLIRLGTAIFGPRTNG